MTAVNADEPHPTYLAADPARWVRVTDQLGDAVDDARALGITDAAAHQGREAVRVALGVKAVSTVDKLVRRAVETRGDPRRLALANALRPAIMRAALLDATPGWDVEPRTGTVFRLYDADGQDVTIQDSPAAVVRRAIRVDLGQYCWGVQMVALADAQGFVLHGRGDDPADAVRQVLTVPLDQAPTVVPPPRR